MSDFDRILAELASVTDRLTETAASPVSSLSLSLSLSRESEV